MCRANRNEGLDEFEMRELKKIILYIEFGMLTNHVYYQRADNRNGIMLLKLKSIHIRILYRKIYRCVNETLIKKEKNPILYSI